MGVPDGSDLFFGFIGVACALVFASNLIKKNRTTSHNNINFLK